MAKFMDNLFRARRKDFYNKAPLMNSMITISNAPIEKPKE